MSKFSVSIERLKRPVETCTCEFCRDKGADIDAAKERAELDAAIRLLEAAEKVDSKLAKEACVWFPLGEERGLLDEAKKIRALLESLPEDSK